LGFRQGGPAGHGLRRVMIDQSGELKGGFTFSIRNTALQPDTLFQGNHSPRA
jgi:hypothetical protein